MAISISRLAILLGVDSKELQTGLSRSSKDISSFAKKTSQTLETAFAVATGNLLSAGISRTLNFVRASIEQSFSGLDRIAKLSDQFGVVPETVQKLGLAAQLAGVQTNELFAVVGKLQKRLSEPTGITVVRQLGIDLADLRSKDPVAQLAAILRGIQKLPTASQRLTAALKLFEETGARFLNINPDDLENRGGFFTRDQLARIEAANDAFSKLLGRIKTIAGEFAVSIAPSIEKALTGIRKFLESEEAVATIKELASAFGKLAENMRQSAEASITLAKFVANAAKYADAVARPIPAGAANTRFRGQLGPAIPGRFNPFDLPRGAAEPIKIFGDAATAAREKLESLGNTANSLSSQLFGGIVDVQKAAQEQVVDASLAPIKRFAAGLDRLAGAVFRRDLNEGAGRRALQPLATFFQGFLEGTAELATRFKDSLAFATPTGGPTTGFSGAIQAGTVEAEIAKLSARDPLKEFEKRIQQEQLQKQKEMAGFLSRIADWTRTARLGVDPFAIPGGAAP